MAVLALLGALPARSELLSKRVCSAQLFPPSCGDGSGGAAPDLIHLASVLPFSGANQQ